MRDPDGIAALFDASNRRLRGLLMAMGASPEAAEDMVQEAFAKLLTRWPRVREYDDPEAWVRTVAVRLFISGRRRERTAQKHLVVMQPAIAAPPDPDRVDVEAAIGKLPLDQRAVVVLHYIADLSVAQISDSLNLPQGTVKSRLSRGRDALVGMLEKGQDD